jgi:Holliday junction DNA helicase RuvA
VIATVSGILAGRDGEMVVVETEGGVGYAIAVPLPVFERLPPPGARVRLHTELVVREDGWSLYGFDRPVERAIFQRLLGASGFGPRLALALLSALGPERTVRGIRERNIAVLSSVSGIGRKKAERLILELQDRFDDLPELPAAGPPAPGSEQAVRALTGLGYATVAAEEAVRGALANGGDPETSAVVRRALQLLAARK